MAQAIKRGVLQSYDAGSQTASVLLLEATNTQLSLVPVDLSITSNAATTAGVMCAVLFFDENNLNDAAVIATYNRQ